MKTIDQTSVDSELTLKPYGIPEILDDPNTLEFISSSRNLSENNGSSVEQIYRMLGIIVSLNPDLSSISANLKNYWISQLLSFQNSNGGFGPWQNSRSSVAATNNAIQSLSWLNAIDQINQTAVTSYLELTRNSITGGYGSNTIDPDSDVHTTYLAAETYSILGATPPNVSTMISVFDNSQNLNDSYVPAVDIGGFGKQSNNIKYIYWTSEATISRYALSGLADFGELILANSSAATSFLQDLQSGSGGFINDPYSTIVTSSYTFAAVKALDILASQPTDPNSAINYLLDLQTSDGGFKKSTTSTLPSIYGTYFAVNALVILGHTFTNSQDIIDYVLSTSRYTDGYGEHPGADSTLRETFDAVSALSDLNQTIDNSQGIIDYVMSYQNPDGGFGLTGSFTESTYRALSIFDLLDYNYPNVTLTVQFLQGLQLPNGGFTKGEGKTVPYVISTYRAIQSLSLLNATPISTTNAIDYLKATQNPDGGFGGFIGDTSDVSTSYRAIRSMNTLNSSDYNQNLAIDFLQGSQNPDGGFKRSLIDVTAPGNFSNAVFTYSSLRALYLLGSQPQDFEGVYSYLVNLHNQDGGYGFASQYSSDIAYVFSSVWILSRLTQLSNFSLSVDPIIFEGETLNVTSYGGIGNISLTYSLEGNSVNIGGSEIYMGNNEIVLNTTTIQAGNYTLNILLSDIIGSMLDTTIQVTIIQPDNSGSDTEPENNIDPNPFDDRLIEILIIGIAVLVIISLSAFFLIRSRSK